MIESVTKRLQKVFCQVFEDDTIVIYDDMQSKDIEEWDSLMHINLIIAIEKEFQIKLRVNELVELLTVGDTIGLIVKKIVAKDDLHTP